MTGQVSDRVTRSTGTPSCKYVSVSVHLLLSVWDDRFPDMDMDGGWEGKQRALNYLLKNSGRILSFRVAVDKSGGD